MTKKPMMPMYVPSLDFEKMDDTIKPYARTLQPNKRKKTNTKTTLQFAKRLYWDPAACNMAETMKIKPYVMYQDVTMAPSWTPKIFINSRDLFSFSTMSATKIDEMEKRYDMIKTMGKNC